nr:hypothetical protein [Tanacetum cinerariifolium]
DEIKNSKAYKEYYAYAMGAVAPKPKASTRKKKGESASSTTPPTLTPTTTVESAPRLSVIAKGKQPSRATTPIEPTYEGTGSKPGVPDAPSDDSEEELLWNSSDDEDVGGHEEGNKSDDDNDEEEELAKDDDEVTETGKGGDEVRESEGKSEEEEEIRQEEEESFDLIPKTPKESEEESNDEEDQDLRLSEEARIQEEEDADELYHDVNINQGRGLQVTQNVEDSHVTLTPLVNPDGPQESSSVSSFVTIMLNPTNDVGVESIFTMASSPIVSLQSQTPIMTPSTIAKITTSGEAPIPSTTIPSIILQNLLAFNSTFRFEERLRSLETSFSEYRQTNPFADAMSAIPGIVHQYMTQQMKEAVREVVQIQTDRLQDSLQRENDEFLRNIDENMKKILKGLVKNQVEVLTRSSHSSRTSYAIAADLSEMELKKILIEKMEGNKSIQRSDEQRNLYKALVEAYDADKAILDTYWDSTILKRRRADDDQEGPSAGSDQGSKRQKEGGEHASASTPSKKEIESASRSTKGSQSRQLSASKSAFVEEHVQTTCQMEEPPHPVFETGAVDQPIIQTSQHPKWFSQLRKPPSPDRAWNTTLPAAQGDAQSWISDLARQTNARSSFNKILDTPIDFSNFIMHRLNIDTLTPDLLAGPTYELMRGSCTSLTKLEFRRGLQSDH